MVLSCNVLKGNPTDNAFYKGKPNKINDWVLPYQKK